MKGAEEAARNRKRNFVDYASYGWYLDPDLPVATTETLLEALRDDDDGAVSGWIEDHYEERAGEIEETPVSAFPSRGAVFRDAFWAHRAAKYTLSVPVLLAQADGIWWEHFGASVFARQDRQLVADSRLSSGNDFDGAMSQIFRSEAPLWESKGQREAGFRGLNRHQVVHGESTDYGTRTNSLKAISFLAFLRFVLASADEGDG